MSDSKDVKAVILVEIISSGISSKDLRFIHNCDVCDCKFKFCIDAVVVVPTAGSSIPKLQIPCPLCDEVCDVDIGKYRRFLMKRKPVHVEPVPVVVAPVVPVVEAAPVAVMPTIPEVPVVAPVAAV